MQAKIVQLLKQQEQEIIERRRDFHKYAETGWTEFRTASIVADTLKSLGYQVLTGDEVIKTEAMMGVPTAEELESQEKRAIAQGAKSAWVEKMHGGKTWVVGILDFSHPGATMAFRFDMDANDLVESEDEAHRPWREGFSSVNKGAMHGCGHDGHTTIGLALAKILVQIKDSLAGRVKLIFQPAEEGVRGAKSMVASGIVDDVDYLIGMHLGMSIKKKGAVTCGTEGFLATTKLDAEFTGVPAHAGGAPETGRNALLAAATAALNLHAISRHSKGISRINVGVLQAGTGRNVIPANALLKLETRGATSEVNEYMYQEAVRILKAAAQMYGVSVILKEMGGAAGCSNSPALVKRLSRMVEKSNLFKEVLSAGNIGGSEDCTYFMERVQQHGGQAAYLMVGADLAAGHHDSRFDFNEEALFTAVALLGDIAVELLQHD